MTLRREAFTSRLSCQNIYKHLLGRAGLVLFDPEDFERKKAKPTTQRSCKGDNKSTNKNKKKGDAAKGSEQQPRERKRKRKTNENGKTGDGESPGAGDPKKRKNVGQGWATFLRKHDQAFFDYLFV